LPKNKKPHTMVRSNNTICHFDLMVPIWAGFSTFWKRLPGSHRARSLVPLFIIIYKSNYIIMKLKVNTFFWSYDITAFESYTDCWDT